MALLFDPSTTFARIVMAGDGSYHSLQWRATARPRRTGHHEATPGGIVGCRATGGNLVVPAGPFLNSAQNHHRWAEIISCDGQADLLPSWFSFRIHLQKECRIWSLLFSALGGKTTFENVVMERLPQGNYFTPFGEPIWA